MSLLKTKLYIPPVRRDLVPRPRLVERLQAGLECRLTLVSAPAGFGKTTLLSECAARCRPSVSWLSLEDRDNNPNLFWTYVVAALQTVDKALGRGVLKALQVPHAYPSETLLGRLANEMSEFPGPLALVLDDLHVILNSQIHEQLIFFLEHLPAQMHLVVSSRADPPWPLARWRARGQVVELRTDDLRFSSEETATFLNDAMGLDLSSEDVAALGARTEGWITGLQLAALAMQGALAVQGRDARAFVRAFSGSHRFVLDYLVEEVLDRQPAAIQAFLLQTSILERLTADLCNAVRFGRPASRNAAGGDDSQAILEGLEQANLFLVPLDDERRWYRYHRLFADLLRSRLQREDRERVDTLHCRASAWYEEHGLISEAVRHALAAGDVEGVTRLARQNTLAIMDHGELTVLASMIEALPDEALGSRPWLCVAHAWVLVFAGLLEAVELRLKAAEPTLETLSSRRRAAEGRHIAGHIAAIRAYVSALRGDMSRAVELSREALERLPAEDRAVRGLTLVLLGSVLRWSGDLAAADEVLSRALADSQAAGDSLTPIEARTSLAAVQLAQGRLHSAVATCRDALRLADEYARRDGRRLPISASGHAIVSQVLREWNDLEGALFHAREGIELCGQWGWPEGLALGYRRLARALQASGDGDGAREAIQKAKHAACELSPWFGAHMAAYEARLWLIQGNLAPAFHWARESGLSASDEPDYQSIDEYSVLARVLIAQGRLDEASELAARLVKVAEGVGAMGCVTEGLVLQALALQALGREDRALTTVEHALTIAGPEGYVRTFIDEGSPVGRLLRRAVKRGMSVEQASKLLAALQSDSTYAATHPALPSGFVPYEVERLSPRETEVLRLLTTHLSHSEIAGELVVSVNTVRSHIKSIYGKLDVHSRLGAVERARELGLLD